jgi:hypothetical protein
VPQWTTETWRAVQSVQSKAAPEGQMKEAIIPAGQIANGRQVGGGHYREMGVQPWDAILDWELGYLDGCAVKYISRWRRKGGVQDIEKARHFLDKLIEVERAKK